MPKITITLLVLLFASGILSACAGDSAPEETGAIDTGPEGSVEIPTPLPTESSDVIAEPVTLRLPMGYIPDPQYAPYYLAVDKGYFADEGITIEFDYSFETDGIALVGAGELPFAVVSGEQVLLARAQGLPVVYIFEWFQRFPIAVISKASSNINEPADLVGRTVGLPGFFGASYVGYAGLLFANGLTEDQVLASDVGFSQIESLLTDQVEAVVGYANNEPLQLENQGLDVNVIMVADSADLVANGIISNEETIANNPELVTEFIRAFTRGLVDTLVDPDEAFEISKRYVEALDDSRKSVLMASLDLWNAQPLGFSDLDSWQNTQQVLLDLGFLDGPLEDLESVFTNKFIVTDQP